MEKWIDKSCWLYLQNVSRIQPFTTAVTLIHATILSHLDYCYRLHLLPFPSANSQHSSLSKCKIVLLVCSKLSSSFPSCSVKARFFTLVYKVPHTLAPLLPSLPPCAPFLTLFIRWAPLFLGITSPLPSQDLCTCHSLWPGNTLPLGTSVWPTHLVQVSLSMSPYLATSYRRAVCSPHTHILLLPAEFPP